MMRWRIVATISASLWASAAAAWLQVPDLAGQRIHDLAGLLSPQLVQQLDAQLDQLEQETGAQVAVLTLASLEGEPLEDYSIRVTEKWQLGRAGVDDGVLLLISRDDRAIRIEVGYGLEPTLTDARSKRIISNLMVPRFRDADFDGGVRVAIDAIDATVRGQEELIPPALMDSGGNELMAAPLFEKVIFVGIFGMVVGTFSLIAVASAGCTGWVLYVFLMPFYFAFPAAALGETAGLVVLGLWIVAFPPLRRWIGTGGGSKVMRGGWFPTAGGGWSSDRWSGGGGGWSGGGFSGGFSGGGGSFGGGGASGSW